MLHVRGPAIPAATVVTDLVNNIDLAPTFMEWAGTTTQTGLDTDGVSWASVAAGDSLMTVSATCIWISCLTFISPL